MRASILLLLVACASAPTPSSSRASDAVLDEWVRQRAHVAAPTLQRAAAEHRGRPEHTAGGRAELRRVVDGGGRRIHVAFRRAPLSEALRLLADEAHVQLVIADDLSGEVSVRLRAVRPYDAMLALAEAHGADVLRNGELVIIRAR